MSLVLARRCVGFLLWGLTLTAALSIARWPGDWGHSVCGIWGCGPPLQALVACHAAWLVVLVPLAILLRRCSLRTVGRVASAGLALSMLGLVAFARHESLTWFVQASDWARHYYWRRVGFVVLTSVEIPLLEVGGLALLLLLSTMATRGTIRHRGAATVRPATGATGVTESSSSITAAERV